MGNVGYAKVASGSGFPLLPSYLTQNGWVFLLDSLILLYPPLVSIPREPY